MDSFLAVLIFDIFHSVRKLTSVFDDIHVGIKRPVHGMGDAPT
jgi:hypothetical protein